MHEPRRDLRDELHRLLLSEEAGVACNLVPRMLADPDSLTPEIRWCLLYFIRGVGYLAARNGLLEEKSLLRFVVEEFERARRRNERLDGLWFSVIRDDERHWIQRYESTDVRYSLGELRWLNEHLARLWRVERERLALAEPPMPPLARRLAARLRERAEAPRLSPS